LPSPPILNNAFPLPISSHIAYPMISPPITDQTHFPSILSLPFSFQKLGSEDITLKFSTNVYANRRANMGPLNPHEYISASYYTLYIYKLHPANFPRISTTSSHSSQCHAATHVYRGDVTGGQGGLWPPHSKQWGPDSSLAPTFPCRKIGKV
jgi:hypothetical protein